MKLLCIDGGGIKGIIPAQIIYRIEKEFGVSVKDYFDAFSGTSAGSMVIGAMVYGNATGEDLVEKLLPNNRAKEIMKQTWSDRIFGMVQLRPKYKGAPKRRLIHENVGRMHLGDTNGKLVLIPSYNVNSQKTHFFKSWDHNDENIPVVDIIDASSAAPSFYPSVKIGSDYYADGAISVNNPTDSAYSDILEKIKDTGKVKILSLGTGNTKVTGTKKNVRNWGGIQWVLIGNIFTMLVKGPENMVNYRTKHFAEALGHVYLRIQGTLENGSIDDTSDENLETLRATGDKWFEDNKSKLQDFFNIGLSLKKS